MSKLNTNSNTYIILYSAVIVIVVAFLLAFVSQSLKPMQDKNVALDVKKQILNSLNLRGLSDEEAELKYNEVVEKVDSIGEGKERRPYIYYCKVDDGYKYVLPLKGFGLWGGISGFIAINNDAQTVYGVFFNHESETAGLGAEIKDSKEWQERFQGKQVFDDEGNVVLSVVKKVEQPDRQVDAVTGATLTSNGVSDMLHNCLSQYSDFIKDMIHVNRVTEDSHHMNANGEYNE